MTHRCSNRKWSQEVLQFRSSNFSPISFLVHVKSRLNIQTVNTHITIDRYVWNCLQNNVVHFLLESSYSKLDKACIRKYSPIKNVKE